jgi:hypothetical protein
MAGTYHLPPMERTREGSTVSIWSNYLGCPVITVLLENEKHDHIAMMTRSTNKVSLKLEHGQFSE